MGLSRLDYYKFLFNVYFLKKGTITRNWRDPSVVDLTELNAEPVTGVYPVDFAQDDVPDLLTDADGVPMINYASLGQHYNPWFVGHIALGIFSKYKKTGSQEQLMRFKKLADWFVKTGVKTSNGITWEYHFDWFGNHNAPWRSGLSQAHAISTLLRAASLFKENSYEQYARMATNEMIATFDEGGATYVWRDGSMSIEESIILPPSTVLNGHLFSVFACWEASNYFTNERYKQVANAGFQFVINRLPDYDIGYWSLYSFKKRGGLPDIASTHYHDVHIAELEVAAAITGNDIFKQYADKFRRYQQTPSNKRKAVWHKRIAKIL